MSAFKEIEGSSDVERARILFFHGLGGDAIETWTTIDGQFWPSWLLEDNPGLYGTTVSYGASMSNWRANSMAISDRATNMAALFSSNFGNNTVPLILVGHSLGGNLIKATIRHMADHKNTDPKFEFILNRIKLVIFLGTPHTGSGLASSALKLKRFVRPSAATIDLVEDSPVLRELNLWYRSNRPTDIKHLVLAETQPIKFLGLAVKPTSSDPGLTDVVPVPIEDNHMGICKPKERASEVYKLIDSDISEILNYNIPKILRGGNLNITSKSNRLISRLKSHRSSLVETKIVKPFTILLCGPTDKETSLKRSYDFCEKLESQLKSDDFDVVRGENIGIDNDRIYITENAISNELDFIDSSCNAVIIVADSIGTWCEFGLFSWYLSHDKESRKKGTDIVVLIDVLNSSGNDFVKRGPFSLAENFGRADYVDFASYDSQLILRRMQERRSVYTVDRRGRPRKEAV